MKLPKLLWFCMDRLDL